jgi:F0F1-type ATP synthase membrane subunit c/vacuolar-type H+-ATPase subunit K
MVIKKVNTIFILVVIAILYGFAWIVSGIGQVQTAASYKSYSGYEKEEEHHALSESRMHRKL